MNPNKGNVFEPLLITPEEISKISNTVCGWHTVFQFADECIDREYEAGEIGGGSADYHIMKALKYKYLKVYIDLFLAGYMQGVRSERNKKRTQEMN